MAAPQAVAHQVMCQIKSSWEFCAEAKFVFKDTRAAAQLHAMNKAFARREVLHLEGNQERHSNQKPTQDPLQGL